MKKKLFSHPNDTTFLDDPETDLDETVNPRVVVDGEDIKELIEIIEEEEKK